ncbi:MAG: prolyl oligopeptidase family serine peptidase [Bacteroidia bacterium]|nr:prolyl oligopeptidase family serine peptidase [Bacteroidia bacterium]
MQKINFITLCSIASLCACTSTTTKMTYPETKRVDTVDVYFGQEVADPYRWLEDDNSAETAEWVKAQNRVTREYLDALPYREEISTRLKQLMNYTKRSAPSKHGEKYFYSKNDGLQNQSVFYMADNDTTDGVVCLDPNKLSEDGTVALSTLSVSEGGKYLGYGIARSGSDWNEFYVRDLSTLEDLEDHLMWIKFSSITWYKDGFFYSRYPQPSEEDILKGENKDNTVCYHKLGTPQSEDVTIYADPTQPLVGYNTSISSDGRVLIITATESTSGNAVFIKRLDQPQSKVVKVIDQFEYDFFHIGDDAENIYLMTNKDASNYQIVAININKAKQNAEYNTILAEQADAIEEAYFENGKLCVTYMHDAYSLVKIYDNRGIETDSVSLSGIGAVGGFSPDKGSEEIYYTFTSFLSPSQIYKYNIKTKENRLLMKSDVQFDFDNYSTEQVFFESTDGARVPMFIVKRNDIKLDGSAPAWIYSYGGFNISMTPSFSAQILAWIEQGGIYAVPNIRGGGEYGAKWHKAGTLMQKKHVFEDFENAARYLIENKYTSANKLTCSGGSNGGLLIGAVVNRHPELFRVALPSVGVMDMLRYHKFTIGRYWATDYGTSEDNVEMFEYLRSYSPVHTIKDQEYPSILVQTGDHDDRVVPAHSFKYIAGLQNTYTGKNPMLIRIDTNAGHGAGKPLSKIIDQNTDVFSFIFNEINHPYIVK